MARLVILTCFCLLAAKYAHSLPSQSRTPKFFPFISFPNENCRGDGGNSWGICYTSQQCTSAGGRRIGSCSYGYGICCSVENDGTSGPIVAVTRNLTTIISPPPNYLPRASHFVFPRQRGVCQLKLDFERFQLASADKNTSNCRTDYMRITGSVTVANLELCGYIAPNDHMYLDYGQGNQIEVTINSMSSDGLLNYGYKFRVTQIRCDSPWRVPQKCLQYFRNETARVTSFNFPYQQLNNHRYTVCVEQRDPSALIQWEPCGMPSNAPANWRAFSLTGRNVPMTPGQIVPPPPDPLPGIGSLTPCAADYVEFFVAGKFCSSNFMPITTPVYEMFVNFDATEPVSLLNDLTMVCDAPPYPPTQPGYQPWISSDNPNTANQCIAKPLSTSIDVGNVGFCLVYSTVHRRIL